MKSLRNHIGTLAFCLSLLLHGSLSYVMLGVFQRQTALLLHQPPLPRPGYVVTAKPLLVPDAAVPPTTPQADPPRPTPAPARPRPTTPPPGMVLLSPPPAPPAAPALPPTPAPAPKPLAKLPDIEELPEVNSEFGQHEGKGASMHASPGDKPMLARKGPQDQAWISRDEVGAGNPNNQPSSDGGKLGAPGLIAPEIVKPDPPRPVQVAALTPTPQPQAPAFGVTTPDQEAPQPPAARPRADSDDRPSAIGPGPLDRPADASPTLVRAPASDTQLALATPAHPPAVRVPPAPSTSRPAPPDLLANARVHGQQGDNGTGKPGNTAADPAPMSDSESDAFSTVGAAVFRNGKLEARFGRQVKTVRPRLNLAGQYDLLSLPSPSVVLKVRADETGRVRRVDIVKSSGSNEVDQPCQLAMYEWWFEPAKDKSGKPLPAEMTWTISWR